MDKTKKSNAYLQIAKNEILEMNLDTIYSGLIKVIYRGQTAYMDKKTFKELLGGDNKL